MQPIPERISHLKDELFSTENSVCLERARIFTRIYAENGDASPEARTSRALAEVFDTMPVFIRPGELIVGQRSSKLGARILYPEYGMHGLDALGQEAVEFWRTRTLGAATRARHPRALTDAESELAAGYQTGTDTGFGHMIADYPKVLTRGLGGIIGDAEHALAVSAGDEEGVRFLDSVITVCRAVVRWANRYAALAEEEAARAGGVRRAELAEIARICRTVPEHPASTFAEALQSFWFIHIALHIEQHGWSISTGRFDQYMYPYLRDDLAAGRLTKDAAWELILGLWIKFMENVGSRIRATTFQNMTLGGGDETGRDTANELSFLCLDATAALRFNQPTLSVRWHPGISPGFWTRAMETIATGIGIPALFNDNVIIDALETHGVAHDDALGYGIVGCVEASVPGKEQGVTAGGHVNLAKALELALNDGRSMLSGKQYGAATGNPREFSSFSELIAAYERQVRALCDLDMTAAEISGEEQKRLIRYPLLSALLDGCLSERRDLVFGSARYNRPGVGIFGSSNVYDSLAAIRKLVFEEKAITMGELADALSEDFRGNERLRNLLINGAPKFGNDDESVDSLAVPVGRIHADYFWEHTDPRGGRFTCGVWPVEGHVSTGKRTAATPDGRQSGTPLVDGVGACQGADRKGPTALLKSAAKIPHASCWTAGNTCNIKFSAASMADSGGIAKVAGLISSYMTLGGQQIQINVVDRETLVDAQARPEKHRDLVVRVAGFSAYFTDLSREVQDEIISRNTHSVT